MVILYKVFAPLVNEWQAILYWVIIASITLANIFAIRQQNLKRFFAYSSISQAGYIMLGVISGTAMGMTGLVYYVLVYMLSNLAAFGVIAVVEHRSGKITIDDYNGLYTTNPRLSFVMMIALFSLAGIPPFAGFFSKFFSIRRRGTTRILRAGFHRPVEHHHLSLLLPESGKGHVYQQERATHRQIQL